MPKLVIESKTHGTHTILFDEEDRELVESHTWHIDTSDRSRTFYANTNIRCDDGYERKKGYLKYKRVKLHRAIMKAPKDMVVDHINHNGLDNRRQNLRLCTTAENVRNSKKIDSFRGKETLSKYKGVSMDKRLKQNPWFFQIIFEGKKHGAPESGIKVSGYRSAIIIPPKKQQEPMMRRQKNCLANLLI